MAHGFAPTRARLRANLGRALIVFASLACNAQEKGSANLPEPKLVIPATATSAPSDAIVLFDGKDLSQWRGKDGPTKWLVAEGVATVTKGSITTLQEFGDVQLHVEWASPAEVKGKGQGRGNSGVFLQDRYEVQILDSYDNQTYSNGQAASIYKQHAPLVNASRKPGEWQVYDIVFRAPKFDEKGNVTRRATITLLHNGILVQDNAELQGSTTDVGEPKYTPHPARAPITLQAHGNPVRFRNIWVRNL